ncbi:MAG: hypothetical protein EZS28_013141 [Streblomastix strix]|uniref:Protein kinase domain-containing protein n=1 Tax=Streblomastix strix TaxID=222440 RepID=A0A5J4W9J1_9EUKA|nr:MAG: hypothetical protein EZS28_013141 [Streblomastix strix]
MSTLSPEKEELIKQDLNAITQQLSLLDPIPLGTGNWGRVYRCQEISGQFVAVKIQKTDEYLDQEYAAAEMLNQLPTEYFIKSFGQYKFSDRVFIVMEYANMQTLQKATDACLMPRVNILIILAHDILEFLSHLHSHNLVHCDIKPPNILFSRVEDTDFFVPKICDFCECSGMETMKTSLEIGGPPFYHPPEVWNKMSNYDGGVDIWELGLVLYLLATGKSIHHPSAFLTLRQYGLALPTDIQPKHELKEINKEQQDLLLDKNGVHLKDTIGNDFLQLLSLMLTFDPRKRPTAAQLLTHHVFTNAQFDISHIPIGYAEELGLKVDYKSQHIAQPNIPMAQVARIPLDKPITKEQKKEIIPIDLNTLAQQLGLRERNQFEDLKLMISEGFQVLKTLGEGGYGRVYLVHHPELGIIAAKIMDNKDFDQREWDISGILNKEACPFIIQNILARKFQTQTVILLEYANLNSLWSLIKKRKVFPLTIIRAILKQILIGLSMMHSKGLIHRDIKGENILLHCPPGTERVFLKLADFGLVKLQKNIDQTTQMTAVGTTPFMPPELLIGVEGDEEVKADSKVCI